MRPRLVARILWLQAVSVPLALVTGALAGFAMTPLFGPGGFGVAFAAVFVVAAPIGHGVLLLSLALRGFWAWERSMALLWGLLGLEGFLLLVNAAAVGPVDALWTAPVLVLTGMSIVYLRHPLVRECFD